MEKGFTEGVRALGRHAVGLIGVEKPAGVRSHPNTGGVDVGALMDWRYDAAAEAYVSASGERRYLLNRLDSPTSGVVLMAETAAVAAAVKAAFAARQVEKAYVAVVRGGLRRSEVWRDCLQTGRGGGLRTRVVRGVPNAEAQVEVLRTGVGVPRRSLLCLRPKTGRTHQLRVQAASRSLPILGDETYGDFRWNRACGGERRLYLHSWKTAVRVAVAGRMVEFAVESPVPAAFERVLARFA